MGVQRNGRRGGDGGPATSAQLNNPFGLGVDAQGDLFIADWGNNRVREVNATTGDITTVAGNGTPGSLGDGGLATGAELDEPEGLAVDSQGDLFIGDAGNCRIQEVNHSTHDIATVAGNGTCGSSGTGVAATSAELQGHLPGLAVDASGNLYIADYNNDLIRMVAQTCSSSCPFGLTSTVAGDIYTVAGNGGGGYSGDNGPATSATFELPSGVAVDAHSGQLLIADSNNYVIRAVNMSTDVITTVAGDGNEGFGGDGGSATSSELSNTLGVAADQAGDYVIADWDPDVDTLGPGYNNIRRVDGTTDNVSTLASDNSAVCGGDTGTAATMAHNSEVSGTALDSQGNLYFSEYFANVVCEVSASTGTVSIVAGTLNSHDAYGGDGGPATDASLFTPFGLAVGNGNLYIADYGNNRVRAVNLTTKVISTVAGDGSAGDTGNGGLATAAEVNSPVYLALDPSGNLYISDGDAVREVNKSTSDISTVVATGGSGIAVAKVGGDDQLFLANGNANGILQEYDLTTDTLTTVQGVESNVTTVAADTSGNVFVSGQNNYEVQRVHLSTGAVSVVAGTGLNGYSGDGGPATAADLYQPMSLTLDSQDDLYIGQFWDGRVREVLAGPSLAITSAAVSGGVSSAADLGPVTVTETDAFGNPVAAPPGGTTLTLTSSSGTGTFSATSSGTPTSSVLIPDTSSSTAFYFGDTAIGSPTITASATGYASVRQQEMLYGPPSVPSGIEGSPSAPGQITVTVGPSLSNGGSTVTGFTVTTSPGGAMCSGTGPSGGACAISGLTGGQQYTFSATSNNAAGPSPAAVSTPVTAVTDPGPPTAISAAAGNGYAAVSFNAPASNGGAAVLSYTVTAHDLTDATRGGQTATFGNGPITVGQLTNGDTYTFTVTATNFIGAGPASAASNPVTPAVPPPPPSPPPPPTWVLAGRLRWRHLHLRLGAVLRVYRFAPPTAPGRRHRPDQRPGWLLARRV